MTDIFKLTSRRATICKNLIQERFPAAAPRLLVTAWIPVPTMGPDMVGYPFYIPLCMPNCSDRQTLHSVASRYSWPDGFGAFQWATEDALSLVCEYLDHWGGAEKYWNPIVAGGPRGYSLFLHEWTEIRVYQQQGADYLTIQDQAKHYERCHAWGLLAEHRFLQVVAHLMDYRLSLRELVEWNPYNGRPDGHGWQGDWHVLSTELHHDLSPPDCEIDPVNEPQARVFYRKLAFEEGA